MYTIHIEIYNHEWIPAHWVIVVVSWERYELNELNNRFPNIAEIKTYSIDIRKFTVMNESSEGKGNQVWNQFMKMLSGRICSYGICENYEDRYSGHPHYSNLM